MIPHHNLHLWWDTSTLKPKYPHLNFRNWLTSRIYVRTKVYQLALELNISERALLDWLNRSGYGTLSSSDWLSGQLSQSARKHFSRRVLRTSQESGGHNYRSSRGDIMWSGFKLWKEGTCDVRGGRFFTFRPLRLTLVPVNQRCDRTESDHYWCLVLLSRVAAPRVYEDVRSVNNVLVIIFFYRFPLAEMFQGRMRCCFHQKTRF